MKRFVAHILAAAIINAPCVALAQSFCADRASVVVKLDEAYGERFIGGGLEGDAYVFEVWASEESGTWTILRTDAHGQACVMAVGKNWREGARPVEGVPG